MRQVPGFADLQRMVALLLAAGGGLELQALAAFRPGWRFTGVDPSADMLAAAARIAPHAPRVALHHGYIDSATAGPFDGATRLLRLHFVPREARVPTLPALRARLKPGAPLVVAHHSFSQAPEQKALRLARHAAFAAASGVAKDKAREAARRIGADLPILSPEADEASLRDAGFADVGLFHAGFTFRSWVATAA